MVDLSKCDTTRCKYRFYARWSARLNLWLNRNTGLHLPWRFLHWNSQQLLHGTSDRPDLWHWSYTAAKKAWDERKRTELLILYVKPE